MEVTTPDGTAVGNLFFVGSNPDPETGLSYLSAADCGVNDPTPTGDIGFPDMHIVFDVNGTCRVEPQRRHRQQRRRRLYANADAKSNTEPEAASDSAPAPDTVILWVFRCE